MLLTGRGRRPARTGALAWVLVLAAIALAGCTTPGAAAGAWSTLGDGGVGLFGGDGAAPGLQVSIEPAAPTVCQGACISLSAQAAGAAPPYAVAWSGLEGDGGTVQVCPAATTTYSVTVTAGATGRGELASPTTTGSASVTVTVTPACAADGGTMHDAAAAVGSGPGREICSQSWTIGGGVASGDANAGHDAQTRMLALDGVGNMYVAAEYGGTANVAGQIFPSFTGAGPGLLVVKVDPACRVLWARAFNAPDAAVSLGGIAADAAGNVVVAASFIGTVDFGSGPVVSGADSHLSTSAVVFKLGPDGAGLWSRKYQASALLYGPIITSAGDVAVDPRGNVVFIVSSWPSLPPPSLPAVDFGGGPVAFTYSVVDLDANGNFVFDADASSGGVIVPYRLAMDSAGDVRITGYEPSGRQHQDIVAFDASGQPQWLRDVAAADVSMLPTVRVDANGEVFTAVAAGTQQGADGGAISDTALYKFSVNGSPSWTSAAISEPLTSWSAWGECLAVDPSGSALVASPFAGSADFGSIGGFTSAGGIDSAVLRFDAQGHLIAGERWGGADDDYPVDVAVDAAGDAVIAGWSLPSAGIDGGSGAAQSNTGYAIFVAKLGW
jgi:hypothetical protein